MKPQTRSEAIQTAYWHWMRNHQRAAIKVDIAYPSISVPFIKTGAQDCHIYRGYSTTFIHGDANNDEEVEIMEMLSNIASSAFVQHAHGCAQCVARVANFWMN